MSDLSFIGKLEMELKLPLKKNPSQQEKHTHQFYHINANDHVTSLNLSGIDLSRFPIDFSQLTELEDLRLGFCELKQIPESIFKLKKLKQLRLTGNDFKPVPAGIAQLGTLELLSIRQCSIKTLPPFLFHLTNLKSLHLSANFITDIPSGIQALTKLESLDIGHNKFDQFPDIIFSLESLRSFEYYGNEWPRIPASIAALTRLERLHLTDCGIESLPADFTMLSNLETLELGGNKLELVPECIFLLPKMQKLVLASNGIHSIPPEIAKLRALEILDISNNYLKDLPGSICQLEQLKELSAQRNLLETLPPHFDNLKKLQLLNLKNNQLQHLPEPGEALTTLFIQQNKIATIPYSFIERVPQLLFDKSQPKSSFNFFQNPLTQPPVNVVAAGRQAALAWYASQKEQTASVEEVKVIVIGDGAAGKTSLINRICENSYNPQESMTHGINIRKTKLKGDHFSHITGDVPTNVTLHLWDFGGQEIMHATHQFFLSTRALYVLVIDNRKDQKIDYWLNHISSFGGDSPVLVVINKMDENASSDVNRKSLQEKYAIKGFFPVSCKDSRGLPEFYRRLAEEVSQMPMLKESWNTKWLAVKKSLESMQQNYVSYDQFLSLCRQQGLTDKEQQKTLLSYLHSLGIVLHFPEFELKDTNVLNPKWVTEAVYKIVNSKKLAATAGVLIKDDLDEILNDDSIDHRDSVHRLNQRYSVTEQNHIIQLMSKFELCFPYGDNRILFPNLLPADEPDFLFSYADSLKYMLEYDFLPKSVIVRFIVKMNAHAKENLIWRTGIMLGYGENEAVVKADESTRRIFVWVSGSDKRSYLAIIRSVFFDIHKTLQRPPEERIPCICSECRSSKDPYFFKYSVLLKAKQRQKLEWPCERSSEDVTILNMIDDVIVENHTEGPGSNNKIFISYAHADGEWLKKIKLHLKAIANEGIEVNAWDDTMIKPGMIWLEEIQRALDHAKIAILLVSTEFLASDFIINNELPALLKSAQSKGTMILPLILKPCRYTKNPALYQFQAVNDPGRPLNTLSEAEQDTMLVNLTNRIEELVVNV